MTTPSRSHAFPGAAAIAVAAPGGFVLLAAVAAVALAVNGGLDRPVDSVPALVAAGASGPAVALRVVLLAATAASAGLGLVAAVRNGWNPAGSGVVRAAWVSGSVTTAACALEVVTGGLARPVAVVQALAALLVPVLLGSPWARAAAVAGLALAGLLGVEIGPGRIGLPLALEVLYGVAVSTLLGALLVGPGGLRAGGPGGLGAEGPGGPGERRVARLVAPSGLLATGAGLAQSALAGPPAGYDVTHTWHGLAALAQAVLPLLVTATWLAAGRVAAAPAMAARLAPVCAVAAGLAVVVASAPATLPPPSAGAEPGVPLARPVELPGRHLAVLVAPMRPGPNLVHVAASGLDAGEDAHGHRGAAVSDPHADTAGMAAGTADEMHGDMHGAVHAGGMHDDMTGMHPGMPGTHASMDGAMAPTTRPVTLTVSAGGVEVPLAPRPGATGLWAVLDIPPGTDRITVSESRAGGGPGGYATGVPVDVGTAPGDLALAAALAGPDGPECASALLGGLLAGSGTGHPAAPPSSCPSQTLAPGDADALRDTVAFLADRGITGLTVVADDSTRGTAAAALVRADAAARNLPVRDDAPGDTLLVVSGWSEAPPALGRAEALARQTATGGIVLAPWLLTAPVLAAASSEVLALPFDPGDTAARRYGALVAAAFPGDGPSGAGHLAWLRAGGAGEPPAPRATFYGAAPVNVPMGMADMDDMSGSGNPGDWYPTGTVVPISPPLGAAGETP